MNTNNPSLPDETPKPKETWAKPVLATWSEPQLTVLQLSLQTLSRSELGSDGGGGAFTVQFS